MIKKDVLIWHVTVRVTIGCYNGNNKAESGNEKRGAAKKKIPVNGKPPERMGRKAKGPKAKAKAARPPVF